MNYHTNKRDLLSLKILTPQDWVTFRQKFNSIYPDFFPLMHSKGYGLTDSEERLLSLEKLNLTSSNIAHILGISLQSVYTARYRLRKRLNVPDKESIIGFLENRYP
ncbi:helix-turn-helix transcriptional regulator [Poritiphilus flavus]|uniref:HTH luxR-type domain-containing protein n=1 Tax=Poritiphilus flavus TaxID=2697053 RepID=A0A6L9ECC0_9FLAO|nr:hypothetical protein [Poritiphilus flavus]NAS12251.1 hypothetical protein [Poritiphilus flavus]